MKIDLHNHSLYSFDCENKIDDIKKNAMKSKIDFIAITDHDKLEVSDDFFISGCEFSTEEGHLIGLFLKRDIKTRDIRELIQEIKRHDGIIVIPHPLRKGSGFSREAIIKYAQYIDAIEVFNPDNTFYGNKVAYKLAKQLDKCMVTGSDAHTINAIGTGASEILNPVDNKEELKRLIKNNKLKIVLDQKYNPETYNSFAYLVLLYGETVLRESGLYRFRMVQRISKHLGRLLKGGLLGYQCR
jgi:predicted metal-dependent phosphoesterase TrpH